MKLFQTILQTKIFQWRYSLFFLSVALWLPMGNAQALTCKVDSFVSPNLGTITLANANNASVEQLLTYSCTSTSDTTEWASVCIGADGGNNNPSQINPRYLPLSGSGSSKLNFNMTLNGRSGATWGPRNGEGTEFIDFVSVTPGLTTTKSTIIKVALLPDNHAATAGDYMTNFTSVNTALTFITVGSNVDNQQCSSQELQGTSPLSFTVQATVDPQCTINTTSDVNLGSHSASQTNITGSNNNAIGVTCTNEASYYIGLAPSNNTTNGAGFMSGSVDNTDKVPYQLRSTAGTGGKIWGNTATTTDVGNGVAGIGSGASQTQTVYVTVPSADFKPDNYSDTVTIRVNY